jgi:conjugative relaxase-like TrwC/TraI family protein
MGKYQHGATKAKLYFRDHFRPGGYHMEGGQVAGYWLGEGGKYLGLIGEIEQSAFALILEGRDPRTGEFIGEREGMNRRSYKDSVLLTSKSLSVLIAFADPATREYLLKCHAEAVRYAVSEMEKHAACRDRNAGGMPDAIKKTGNLICAAFTHETARPSKHYLPDPFVHTHLLNINLTRDDEGRYLALQDIAILQNQKLIVAAYDAHITKMLTDRGIEIEPDGRGSWRIKCVDPRADNLFSKRGHEIKADTKKVAKEIEARTGKQPNIKDVAQVIAHKNRQAKQLDKSYLDLRREWSRQLRAAGLREDGKINALGMSRSRSKTKSVNARKSLNFSIAHLMEREAVVRTNEVLRVAIGYSLGSGVTLDQVRAEIARQVRAGTLLQSGDYVSTREALHDEQELLKLSRKGRGKVQPLVSNYVQDENLRPEQNEAARLILTSCDQTVLLIGRAGAGKSHTLKKLTDEISITGREVLLAAPMGKQVSSLRQDGFTKAQTVAALMQRPIPRESIVIVDECGQVGIKDMNRLQRLVRAANGRLILVGDPSQHGSVARGDSLRQLASDPGITCAMLSEIQRQDPTRGRTDQERKYIAAYKQAVEAAGQGQVQKSFEMLDRLGAVREVIDPFAETARLAHEKSKDGTVLVVTQTRMAEAEADKAIREKRVADGMIMPNGRQIDSYRPADFSEAERKEIVFYKEGMVLSFAQKHGDFANGSIVRVAGVDRKKNQLILKNESGKLRRVGMGFAAKWQIVEELKIEVGSGDQLQLKRNATLSNGKTVSNGEIVSIKSISEKGEITLQDGRTLPTGYRMFKYGYASTSYAAQGKTVEHLIGLDAGETAATNCNQYYVDVTRGRRSATIVTADKLALKSNIQKSGAALLASHFQWKRQSSRDRLHALALRGLDAGQTALLAMGLSPLLASLQSAASLNRQRHNQTHEQPPMTRKPQGASRTMLPDLPHLHKQLARGKEHSLFSPRIKLHK